MLYKFYESIIERAKTIKTTKQIKDKDSTEYWKIE